MKIFRIEKETSMLLVKVGGAWINPEAIDRIEPVSNSPDSGACNVHFRGGQMIAVQQSADSLASDISPTSKRNVMPPKIS